MAKTVLYVFKVKGGFVRVGKTLKLSIVKTIEEAGYWTNKSDAKSWENTIKNKYPDSKMKEATLKLK